MYPRNFPVLAAPAWSVDVAATLPPGIAPVGMSFAQWRSILAAYRKQTLMIICVVVALVGIACALWPRTYLATTTMMVNYEINDPLAEKEFPIGLLANYIATQVELAQTSEVLLPVIARLKLTEDRAYTAGFGGEAEYLPQWVATELRKNLRVEQGYAGSHLIRVTYEADDPADAALIANTVAETFSERHKQRTVEPATERATRYKEQLDELQRKVISAQQQATEFYRRTGLIGADVHISVDIEKLGALEQRLLEAQQMRRVAESRLLGNASMGTEVMSSTVIQTLKGQLATQQAQMAQLSASLGPRHPQVVELRAQMEASRRSLATEVGAYSGNANRDVAAARAIEQGLAQAVAQQRERLSVLHGAQDDGAKFLLELESAKSVYKRALDGYDQVMFAAIGGYTNIAIADRATPPLKASSPKVMKTMLLALIAGILLGIIAPLLYELAHRRVRCRDDLERDHGIPVLVEFGPILDTRMLT